MQTRSSVLTLSLLAASLVVVACSGSHGIDPNVGSADSGNGGDDPLPGDPADAGHDANHPDTAPPPPACGGFSSSKTACNTCIQGTCCSAGAACGANPDCMSLASCIEKCTTSACTTGCESTYAAGVDDLSTFLSCTSKSCDGACTTASKGIGDACSSNAECLSGECGGNGSGWCTKSCSQNTDCTSKPSSVTNEYGNLDWCVKNTGGASSCFPGCTYDSDCTPYGSAHCQAVTAINGASTHVCSF